jgi:hypothetical protein
MFKSSPDQHASLWRQAVAALHTSATVQPTHEEIAARAYERYVSRRGTDGSPAHDWVEAERELLSGANAWLD